MNYYFIYLDDAGRVHKKRFDNVASAVRWRKSWCANSAQLRFDMAKNKLEKSLDVKVDTKEKAEELFDNLVADAMHYSAVLSETEFQRYQQTTRRNFEKLNGFVDVD